MTFAKLKKLFSHQARSVQALVSAPAQPIVMAYDEALDQLPDLLLAPFLSKLSERNDEDASTGEADWTWRRVQPSQGAVGLVFQSSRTQRMFVYYDYFLSFDSRTGQWVQHKQTDATLYGPGVLCSEVESVKQAQDRVYNHYMNLAH